MLFDMRSFSLSQKTSVFFASDPRCNNHSFREKTNTLARGRERERERACCHGLGPRMRALTECMKERALKRSCQGNRKCFEKRLEIEMFA